MGILSMPTMPAMSAVRIKAPAFLATGLVLLILLALWEYSIPQDGLQQFAESRIKTIPIPIPIPIPNKEETFPTKIWQSWKDNSQDPTDRTIGFPHKWREMNPDWRYERITDSNNNAYVQANFDLEISEVFTNLTDPIMKADYLRYLVLLKEGGVYADIDVNPQRPVKDWVPEEFKSVNLVVGIENDHHKKPIWPGSLYSVQLCQYVVLAKPNHPAIKRVVDLVTAELRRMLASPTTSISFEDVMSKTGPFVFTKVIMQYLSENSNRIYSGDEFDNMQEPQQIRDVLLMPKVSFGWMEHEKTHEKGHPSILVQHLFIGSWRGSHPG